MKSEREGPESPGVLRLRTRLSKAYLELQRYSDAEKIGRSVLETNWRVRGADHMNTLDCMDEFRETLRGCGFLEEAAELGLDVVRRRRMIQGVDDPRTHKSAAVYCGVLRELRRDGEARQCEREWERIFGIPVEDFDLLDRLHSWDL